MALTPFQETPSVYAGLPRCHPERRARDLGGGLTL